MGSLEWTTWALLVAILVSACGKTGADSPSHGDPTGTAGSDGEQASGGATAGQSIGGAGDSTSTAGTPGASGAPPSAGDGGQSAAGAGNGAAGMAGSAGAPMKTCADDADCAESQFATETCNDGVCGEGTRELTTFPNCGDLLLQPAAPSLYVLDAGAGTLFRVAFGATDAPTPVATGLTNVKAFALSDDAAYVATKAGVQRLVLANGAVSTVTESSGPVEGIATAGGKLYYTVGSHLLTIDASAQAGQGSVLATGMNSGLPNSVVVSGDFVLFNADGSFNIEGVELGPKRHFKLSASQTGMLLGHRSILTDGQYVYWEHDGFLNRNQFAGNDTGQRGLGFCSGVASAIAFTPQATYCGDEQGRIAENRFGASTPRSIARNLGKVTSLVVEDHKLYLAHACKLSSLQL